MPNFLDLFNDDNLIDALNLVFSTEKKPQRADAVLVRGSDHFEFVTIHGGRYVVPFWRPDAPAISIRSVLRIAVPRWGEWSFAKDGSPGSGTENLLFWGDDGPRMLPSRQNYSRWFTNMFQVMSPQVSALLAADLQLLGNNTNLDWETRGFNQVI
ncbi:MAG: hypothetical protein C0616_08940 [Desulfuromonas sp.]|nr:MAG: hypothetical protein C0616_08940 [Desulfuromonas sp.]